jgi:hypothetical protein
MIPPVISPSAPPGERRVFERLASDPLTDDWVVLHSLALAEHVRQAQGEADFVVLVPGYGVAVIEVKSHTKLARLPDGRWRLGSLPPTGRGPFQQADEQMHSIRRYLRSRGADLRTVLQAQKIEDLVQEIVGGNSAYSVLSGSAHSEFWFLLGGYQGKPPSPAGVSADEHEADPESFIPLVRACLQALLSRSTMRARCSTGEHWPKTSTGHIGGAVAVMGV